MNPEQARDCVEKTFRQKFDDARFLYFIRNLVNHLDESQKQTWTLKKAAFEDYVNHFTRLGTYTDPRGERADLLVIHLRKDTTLARGRVTLRNFVADYLATGHGQGKAAVMAAFVSPLEEDWRFSFVKLDYKLLGQIVFLYFLQKKGWFGVERGKTWGSGRKDFIRHLFNNRADYAHIPGQRKRPANFFDDILEPLFYEAIAAPRTDEDHYYSRFDCKIVAVEHVQDARAGFEEF